MDDCLFCKIINGNIPSNKVYEDDKIICFKDIHPLAPVHVLVVPKKHITSLCDVNVNNSQNLAYCFEKIPEIVDLLGIKYSGFRTIINTGKDGAQSVPHVHIHILGGKQFSDGLGENTSL